LPTPNFKRTVNPVPWSLERFHESGHSHFVTFSCYRRRPLLQSNKAKQTFLTALERVRRTHKLYIYGYVIMPEHVHLLISEPPQKALAAALKSLKQGVARRLIGEADHFWQKRYYDRNTRTYEEFKQKLRYIHRNPIKRGLCKNPEDYPWSTFIHYATGLQLAVEIESEWTARRREVAPSKPFS
jgi:putative transposase